MVHHIKLWKNGNILYEIEADSIKHAVKMLVKQRADLYGANLYGANLSEELKANEAKIIKTADEAIKIAVALFSSWEQNGFDSTRKEYKAYAVTGETRAMIIFAPGFQGGWCYVLKRQQIWWWNWSCPNPETVPIIWDGTK